MDTDQPNSAEEEVNGSAPEGTGRPKIEFMLRGAFGYNFLSKSPAVEIGYKKGAHGRAQAFSGLNGRYVNVGREVGQLLTGFGKPILQSNGDAVVSVKWYDGEMRSVELFGGLRAEYDGGEINQRILAFDPVTGEITSSVDASVRANLNVSRHEVANNWVEGEYAFHLLSLTGQAEVGETYPSYHKEAGGELIVLGPNIEFDLKSREGIQLGYILLKGSVKGTASVFAFLVSGKVAIPLAFHGEVFFGPLLLIEEAKLGFELLPVNKMDIPAYVAFLNLEERLKDPTISPYQRAQLEDLRDNQAVLAFRSRVPAADLEPRAITNGPGDGPPLPPPGGAAPAPDQLNPHVQFNIFPDDWRPGDHFGLPGIDNLLQADYLPEHLQQPPQVNPVGPFLPGPVNLGQVQQLPATPAMMLPFEPNPAFMIKPAQGGFSSGFTMTATELNDQPAIEVSYNNEKTGTTVSAAANSNGDVQGSISQGLTAGGLATAAKLAPWALVAVAVVGFVVKERRDYQDRCDKAHENRVEECRKEQEEIMQKQHGEVFAKIYKAICSRDFEAVDAAIKEGESIPKEVTLPNYADLKEPVTLTFDYSYQPVTDLVEKLAKQPKDPDFHLGKIAETSVKSEDDWESELQIGYSASFVNSVVSDLVGGEYYLHAADLADKLIGNLKLADKRFVEPGEQRRVREDLRFSGNHQVASIFVGQVQQLVSTYVHQLPENYWKSKVTLAALEAVQIAVPTAPTLALLRLTADPEIFSRNVANYIADPRADLYTGTQVLLQSFTFFLTYADSIPIPRSFYGSSKNRRWWLEKRNEGLFYTSSASGVLSASNAACRLMVKGLGTAFAPMHITTLALFKRKWGRGGSCRSIDPASYRHENAVDALIEGAGALGTAFLGGAQFFGPTSYTIVGAIYLRYILGEDPDVKKALNAAMKKVEEHLPKCDEKAKERDFSFNVYNNEHLANKEHRSEVRKALFTMRDTLGSYYNDYNFQGPCWDTSGYVKHLRRGLIYREKDSERSDDQSPSINDVRLFYLNAELNEIVKDVAREFPCLTDDSEESANPQFEQAPEYQTDTKEQFNRRVKEYQEEKERRVNNELRELQREMELYFKDANAEKIRQLFDSKEYMTVIGAIGCEKVIYDTTVKNDRPQPLINGKLPLLFGCSLILRRLDAFARSPVRLNEFKSEYDRCVSCLKSEAQLEHNRGWKRTHWPLVVERLEKIVYTFFQNIYIFASHAQSYTEAIKFFGIATKDDWYDCCRKRTWEQIVDDDFLCSVALKLCNVAEKENANVQSLRAWFYEMTLESLEVYGRLRWLIWLGCCQDIEWLLLSHCEHLLEKKHYNELRLLASEFVGRFNELEAFQLFADFHICDQQCRAVPGFTNYTPTSPLDVLSNFLKVSEDRRGLNFWRFLLEICDHLNGASAYISAGEESKNSSSKLSELCAVCLHQLNASHIADDSFREYVKERYAFMRMSVGYDEGQAMFAKVEELHDREQINLARNPNAHFAPPQPGPADEGLRHRRDARAQAAA